MYIIHICAEHLSTSNFRYTNERQDLTALHSATRHAPTFPCCKFSAAGPGLAQCETPTFCLEADTCLLPGKFMTCKSGKDQAEASHPEGLLLDLCLLPSSKTQKIPMTS